MAYDGTLKFDTAVDAKGMQNGAGKMQKIVTASFAAIGAAATAALAVIGKVGVGYNAQMEEYTTNFTTMLGSQEAAVKKVEELKVMAAKTPFGMEDLAKGTQTLLAFGIESDKTQNILRQIGDVALGDKGKFEGLTLSFAQMSATGRLMGQDLNQMINAGFNPLQVISEKTGKSMGELKAAMEDGAISSEMVAEAFAIATSEGGKFYNGMEAASKTLKGQWSTLMDDASATAGTLFKPFNDVLSSRVLPNVIDLVADLNDNLSDPKMEGAMTKIADGFGDLIEGGAELVSTVLPPLITVIAGVVSAIETLLPVMALLGVAFAAYKTYTFVTNFYEGLMLIKAGYVALLGTEAAATAGTTAALWAYNAAQNAKMIALLPLNAAIIIYNALTGSSIALLGGATAAQWGLNAAMLANPVGLIVAGVAALVVGITALILWLSKGSEEYQKQKEEMEELSKAHEEYEKQLDADKDAADQAIAKTKAQSEANNALVGDLRNLMATNDKAGSNNAAIARTVDQLNGSVEGLGLSYDETTGKLSASIDEVEAYVKAQGDLAVIQAQEDEYNRLLGEQLDLQAKIAVEEARQAELLKQKDAGIISQGEYNDLINRSNELIKEYGETEQQLAVDVQAAHAAIDMAAKESATAQVNAYEAINGARDAEGNNLRQLAKLYGTTTDEILAEMAEQGLSMEEWSARKAENFTKEGQSLQGVANQWGMTTDEVLAYMDEWGMSLDEFATEMEETHTKEGLSLDDLAAKWGTTAEAVTAEMDNMGLSMQEWSDQQQEEWEEYQQTVADQSEAVINSFKEIPAEYEMSAAEMIQILQTNRERYAEWKQAMVEISGQVSAETLAELEKLGPGALSAINEMRENGGAGLREFDAEIRALVAESTDYVIQDWNDPAFTGAPSGALDASAQQVSGNTALQSAVTTQMESARTAAEAVDFTSVGQGIATDIAGAFTGSTGQVTAAVSSMNSSVQGIFTTMSQQTASAATQMMNNVAAAVTSGAGRVTSGTTGMSTSVQGVFRTMSTQSQSTVTQMMTSINSTIVSRASTIRASITSMGSGITSALSSTKTQSVSIVTQMMTEMNSAVVTRSNTIKASITSMGSGITTSLNTLKTQAVNIVTQMMTEINSAIVSRTNTVKASATALVNAVGTALDEMANKGQAAATKMMTDLNSTIVSRTSAVKSAATAVANGVTDALKAMETGAVSVANSMMNGIYNAMQNKAGELYDLAEEIADNIADTMADALDVNSPSRVMIRLFGYVMAGIYKGMEDKRGMLYREAGSIADGLAERLAVSPDVFGGLFDKLRAVTVDNPLGGATLIPQLAAEGAGGGVSYTTTLTQHITSPKPLSPSEMTREGQDLLRRSRWQLP